MKRTNARDRIELDANDLLSLIKNQRVVDEEIEIVVPNHEWMRAIGALEEYEPE